VSDAIFAVVLCVVVTTAVLAFLFVSMSKFVLLSLDFKINPDKDLRKILAPRLSRWHGYCRLTLCVIAKTLQNGAQQQV
jgi:hypothetical protein